MKQDKREAALLVVIMCIKALISLSASSVLDLPVCKPTGEISEERYMSTSHPNIAEISPARTLVECFLNCWKNFPVQCSAAFRDNHGACYQLRGDNSNFPSSSVGGAVKGDIIRMMGIVEGSDCNGRNCSDSQVCIGGCENTHHGGAICVGDQQDECELRSEYTNIIHYWSPNIGDHTNEGIVMTATYPKSRDDSGLRVIIHMAVRGHCHVAGYCTRWYLTFDGDECTNPSTIEMLDYSLNIGDHHRTTDIDGTCYGLGAGDKVVRLLVGPCTGYITTNSFSGWNSARTMLIMEMVPMNEITDENLLSCPLLNAFNYKYETWREFVDQTVDLHNETVLIKEVTYTKLADDTNLRIKYSSVSGVYVSEDEKYYCARWFVKIGGDDCSPQLDYFVSASAPNNFEYWRDHRRTRTLEGVCENRLAKGTHNITLHIGRCIEDNNQPTRVINGWLNSPSRLHIEEVRTEHAVDGVVSHNQKMFRSHSGNLERFHYWASNKGDDEGDLFTITYMKEYADTGLRLTASGDHRIIYFPAVPNSLCARWFFKIDDTECDSPGVIEGVVYFDLNSNSHQPMQVSGMCHGISLGSHTITYAISYCPGYSHTDAYTGWQSSFHIFVEELRVDLVKTCSSTPVNCDL